MTVSARERIIAFMPDYAAYMLNRLHRGEDGKVPYERLKGKIPRVLGLEFGEKVLFKPINKRDYENLEGVPRRTHKNDYSARMVEGVYVGTSTRNGEHLMMTPKGVVRGSHFHRLPGDQQYAKDNYEGLIGWPWDMRPKEKDRGGTR